jgi:hypothetical protein
VDKSITQFSGLTNEATSEVDTLRKQAHVRTNTPEEINLNKSTHGQQTTTRGAPIPQAAYKFA